MHCKIFFASEAQSFATEIFSWVRHNINKNNSLKQDAIVEASLKEEARVFKFIFDTDSGKIIDLEAVDEENKENQ